MNGLLGIPLGERGTGRARYGHAVRLWAEGRLTDRQLEAYRIAAADDRRPPHEVLADLALPVPQEAAPPPPSLIATLLDEADRYLASLAGPGLAEVRAGLARWRSGPIQMDRPAGNAVVDEHLATALTALAADRPALAGAIAAASPHLAWTTYDAYPLAEIGEGFARGHAYATLVGEGAPLSARDFDLGLFLIAPQVLYRDHAHAAPELYAPLTGPHGWRFGPERPLVVKPAHVPVWNTPFAPHLTKVGPVPFLSLFGWTRDTAATAFVIPASDWPRLEELVLG